MMLNDFDRAVYCAEKKRKNVTTRTMGSGGMPVRGLLWPFIKRDSRRGEKGIVFIRKPGDPASRMIRGWGMGIQCPGIRVLPPTPPPCVLS